MKIDVITSYITTYELTQEDEIKIATFIKENPHLMEHDSDYEDLSNDFNIQIAIQHLVEHGELHLTGTKICAESDCEYEYDLSQFETRTSTEILRDALE